MSHKIDWATMPQPLYNGSSSGTGASLSLSAGTYILIGVLNFQQTTNTALCEIDYRLNNGSSAITGTNRIWQVGTNPDARSFGNGTIVTQITLSSTSTISIAITKTQGGTVSSNQLIAMKIVS